MIHGASGKRWGKQSAKQSQDRDFTPTIPACPHDGTIFLSSARQRVKLAAQRAKKSNGASPFAMKALAPAKAAEGRTSGNRLISSADQRRPRSSFLQRPRRRSPFQPQWKSERPIRPSPRPGSRRLQLRRPRTRIRMPSFRTDTLRNPPLRTSLLRSRSRPADRRRRRSWAAGHSCGLRSSARGADGGRAG